MPHHLEPVPSNLPADGFDPFEREEFGEFDLGEEDDQLEPLVRPSWWRWVAVVVIVAMAVAGPFAYALYKLLS